MSKNTLAVVAAIAGILILTGCSSTPTQTTDVKTRATTAATGAQSSETASAPPALTAKPTSVEQTFLTATHRIPGLENVSMEAALKVGHYVCGQLDAGVSPLDITAVKSDDFTDNEQMIMVSTLTLCKDHNDAVQKVFQQESVKRNATQP